MPVVRLTMFPTSPSSFAALVSLAIAAVPHVVAKATDADWHALNASLGGSLHSAKPFAASCYPEVNGVAVTPDAAQCALVQENYLNASYRTSLYSGFIHTYNEGCVSNTTNQCLLNPDALQMDPVTGSCNQGIVSEKYIEVTGHERVQAAINFSIRTSTPLSIKASGHDYMARSSLQGSLALWTRNLNEMTYHPSFIPSGNKGQEPVRAITVGAGANFAEIYAFAETHNVTFVGGSSATVTAAGGFTLFGGHGVLSPLYGLGADRVLEFHMVTADGVLRTANANTYPDLFWALRGGGAGAFGVVLSATIKVEPAIPLTLAYLSFNATSSNTLPFLSLLVNHSAAWANDSWGGPMGPSYLAMVNPRLSLPAAKESMAEAAAYVDSQNGSAVFQEFRSFYAFYEQFVAPASSTGVASATLASFRTLPKRLHQTEEGCADIVAALAALINAGLTPYIFQTTPASFASAAANDTSVHPSWRDSYWMVGTSLEWAWNAALAERTDAVATLQQVSRNLTALAPDGAMYPNEADPWTEGWREEFWGPHYPELLRVKRKYDPRGLFNCWKCVGFEEGREDPAYGCLGAFEGYE